MCKIGNAGETDVEADSVGIRAQSLRGGMFLVAREVGGMLVRATGTFAVIALIGPGDFGRYSAAWAFSYSIAIVAQLGTEIYLVRRETLDDRTIAVASAVLVVSAVVAILVSGVLAAIGFAIGVDLRTLGVFGLLTVSLPLNIWWAPAQAVLERNLRFGPLAALEFGSDVVLYGVAVPAALAGSGVWSLAMGIVASQAFLLVGSFRLAGLRPAFCWDRAEMRVQTRFGIRYAGFTWSQRARDLASPLVAGIVGGPVLVGQVALAIRILESFAFVYRSAYRLSMAAINRFRDDAERVRRASHESVMLKVLFIGPVLAGLGLVVDPMVRRVFGPEWSGTVEVFPFLAAATLLAAIGTTGSVLLVSYDRLRAVSLAETARAMVVVGVAFAVMPSLGARGYGIAECVACVTFVPMLRAVPVQPVFRWRAVAPWIVVFLVPLAGSFLEPEWRPLLVVPLAILLIGSRSARRTLHDYRVELFGALRRAPRDGSGVCVVAWTRRPSRNRELAAALDGECWILEPRREIWRILIPLRYVVHGLRTFVHLSRTRPRVVIATAPPVPTGAVAVAWGRLAGRTVILDCHPASFGVQGDRVSERLQPLHRWALRRADAVLVTTDDWVRAVGRYGTPALVVHEPPPLRETEPAGRPTRSTAAARPTVLYVCVFAPDEPLHEVLDAAREMPEVDIAVTGDLGRCPEAARRRAPENVRFTGYLHGAAYDDAVRDCDVVLALTTESTSIMRAAYEAVYAERPLVVSDWPALIETFPFGIPTSHAPTAIAHACRVAMDLEPGSAQRARRVQVQRWTDQLAALSSLIGGSVHDHAEYTLAESPREEPVS